MPGRWSSALAAVGAGSSCEGKSRMSRGLVPAPLAPGVWGDVLPCVVQTFPMCVPLWVGVGPAWGPQGRRDGVEGGGDRAVLLRSLFSQVWGCGRGEGRGAAVL